jgi:hypothetical protein
MIIFLHQGKVNLDVYISLISITRDSIGEYSHTTCIHCNDLYFDIWISIKNIKEKSEEYLKKIFEKKCDRCIDADEIRSKLGGSKINHSDAKKMIWDLNHLGMTRCGI